MAFELMETVKQAEALAESKRLEALNQARRLVKDAEDACARREKEAQAAERRRYREALDAREKAALDQAAAVPQAPVTVSDAALQKASAYLAERVLNHGHR